MKVPFPLAFHAKHASCCYNTARRHDDAAAHCDVTHGGTALRMKRSAAGGAHDLARRSRRRMSARRHHGTNPCATGIDRNNRKRRGSCRSMRKAQARGIPQSAAQGRGTQRREPAGNASDHRRRYAFSRNACAYSTTVKQPRRPENARAAARGSARERARACRPRSSFALAAPS